MAIAVKNFWKADIKMFICSLILLDFPTLWVLLWVLKKIFRKVLRMILKKFEEEKIVLFFALFLACRHIFSQISARNSHNHEYNIQKSPFHILYPWLYAIWSPYQNLGSNKVVTEEKIRKNPSKVFFIARLFNKIVLF